MEYNFSEIEQHWKKYWTDNHVYKVENPVPGETAKPKFYVLDMFPYPSGAGLHVGHPLGYVASDIYARYKRLCGYNVLHPMGYDAFGLPAEQYALETGQHPVVTTEENIKRYRQQLDNIGFSYDWDRQVRTSEPDYYKWTQWIFLQLFHSWYDRSANKARPIADLVKIFELTGNDGYPCPGEDTCTFTAEQWKAYTEKEQRAILMNYRNAYQGYAQVWWCEALGTVLANDEVVNGVSERGGHPVERKNMRQWFLRITEFAERLLNSLDNLDWSEAMKEMQRNWIGKSNGAEVAFKVSESDASITVFTTRPDTIFGVDFMVLAPEHELVDSITSADQKQQVEEYKVYVKSRSERERMSEVKQVTGAFTGAYVIHPFTGKKIPVWISEYVLAGYGTGAIMAVPSGDDRDHAFAKHFNIDITNVFGDAYTGDKAYSSKTGTIENSDFLNDMPVANAIDAAIDALVNLGVGKKKVNYKLRDAGFSRQRYWGEPFPIVYKDNVPYGTDELNDAELAKLPVELPMVEHYKPGPEGQGPLANIPEWMAQNRETNTMPGYAGSSWYFLRYMDPHNDNEFASRAATDYWQQVDLYVGGTEHAVGHLLYSRMWTKALHDLGYINFDEPFKKLLNQGMIQGISYFVKNTGAYLPDENKNNFQEFILSSSKANEYSSKGHFQLNGQEYHFTEHIRTLFPITSRRVRNGHLFVDSKNRLTKSNYLRSLAYYNLTEDKIQEHLKKVIWDGRLEDGEEFIICDQEVEKMSKSKYNVVNPDDIIKEYGADTFRMYEMFLGPIDMSKPWDTKGIEGVHRFLKKLWRLYADEQKGWIVTDEAATDAELKVLHKTIKKISDDMERFSFNTSVSQFMITVNELSSLNCHKRAILEPLAILICPFAPHMAEELWHKLGHTDSVVKAAYPVYEEKYTVDNTKNYPVAINGKARVEMEFALDADQADIEKAVLANEAVQKWMEGKQPKKIIFVKGKMINIVI
jgi:leucyl-tRNA synthetase